VSYPAQAGHPAISAKCGESRLGALRIARINGDYSIGSVKRAMTADAKI
jgi:hypothetical protein